MALRSTVLDHFRKARPLHYIHFESDHLSCDAGHKKSLLSGWFSGNRCFCSAVSFDSRLRAGMMASRLYHRERVIPALTDHLEDKGGVIGAESSPLGSGYFKPFCRTLCGYAFRGLVVIYRSH